jgi:hypothetical protein
MRYFVLRYAIVLCSMGISYALLLLLRDCGMSAESRGIWTGAVACALTTLGWGVLDLRDRSKKKKDVS